jgi:tetratricopeptide (TPR) repeat protein
MRMNTGRTPEPRGGVGCDVGGGARTVQVGAGHDLARDTRDCGIGNDPGEIGGKAFMREIRADVDEFHVQAPPDRVYLDYMLHRLRRFGRLILVALCAAAQWAHAQQGGDLQARILYAYQTEDTNQLTNLAQTLTTQIQAGANAAFRYHLAHAEYRLGLLAGDGRPEGRPKDAEAAFSECTLQLKELLVQDVNSAESLVLQSVCYGNLARFKKVEAILDRARAADRLKAAAKIAPRNPRVVFFESEDALAAAPPDSAQSQRAFQQLMAAVELFEGSSATRDDVPGWGHAEAYLELGRRLQARGDVVGARNWIEKALIVAPDYKAAQRQLTALVRR